MVNTPKKNFSPLPAGKFGKSDNPATLKRHRTNAGKGGIESERIRALQALRTLRSKKKAKAAASKDTVSMTQQEREKWIEDYVERETAVARRRVEEADAAWELEKERLAAEALDGASTASKSKTTFAEMLKGIDDSIDDIATSDEDDEDDEDEDEEEDDIEGEIKADGTMDISDGPAGVVEERAQKRIDTFREMCKQIDEVTRPGWEAAENYFRERDKKYNCGIYGSMAAETPISECASHSEDTKQIEQSEFTVLPTRQKRIVSITTVGKLEERPRKRSKSAGMVGGLPSIIIWFGDRILIR